MTTEKLKLAREALERIADHESTDHAQWRIARDALAAIATDTDPAAEAALAQRVAGDGGERSLTDQEIMDVWHSMPGGPSGWLKEFGFMQFARAIEAALTKQKG